MLEVVEDGAKEVTNDVTVVVIDPRLIRGVRESRHESVGGKVGIDEWVTSRVVGQSISHSDGDRLKVGALEGAHGHELIILRRV
jgi:hypothetical protein